ncbi:hypothetical protein [Marinobacter adhaerens]|jgi:hypothetical protein|uniref:hypothetical protein n=1 Tax=Marinobacter adhaerens TaxID=1033846 RepID=UPI003BAC6FE0
MKLFCAYLVLVLTFILVYTGFVGIEHGWNLLPIFFDAIADMSWQGQFNVDFISFLALSALWVSWRHQFSNPGLLLGVIAFFGGMIFLALYLLWAIAKADGRSEIVLLGPARVAQLKARSFK